MSRRRLLASGIAVALLLTAWAPGVATAAKPEKFTQRFSATFRDPFLSDECGVRVDTTVRGRLTFLIFPQRRTGPLRITSVHVDVIARAGDNRARFKDVGIDKIQRRPGGRVILMIVGQVPFFFKGVTKIDLDTGEVLKEAHRVYEPTRVCRLLTR